MENLTSFSIGKFLGTPRTIFNQIQILLYVNCNAKISLDFLKIFSHFLLVDNLEGGFQSKKNNWFFHSRK